MPRDRETNLYAVPEGLARPHSSSKLGDDPVEVDVKVEVEGEVEVANGPIRTPGVQ
jgi:hypothetical protein